MKPGDSVGLGIDTDVPYVAELYNHLKKEGGMLRVRIFVTRRRRIMRWRKRKVVTQDIVVVMKGRGKKRDLPVM